MKKRVLVACGTGIATSTVVSKKLEEAFKNNGLDAEIVQCKVSEIDSKKQGIDLIVTTTNYESKEIPVIRAISFLTGINMDADMQKIIDILK